MAELTPSLLAADLLNIERDIQKMMENGVYRLHFDVMDAHFVPNLSFSPALCKAIRWRFPQLTVDAHLMMDNALLYLRDFAMAGAGLIVLHEEVHMNVRATMASLQAMGVRRGLSVKPRTPVDRLLPYLDCLDHILVMTVEPGFGGQRFMPEQLEKIRTLRAAGFSGEIAVDGGVNMENAVDVIRAGGDVLVMGTSYFHAQDPAVVVRAVKGMA